MLRNILYWASALGIICALVVVGCDTNDRGLNSQDEQIVLDEPVEFNPIEGNEITVDSLNALARAQYLGDVKCGAIHADAAGWVFNINMPSFYSQYEMPWMDDNLGFCYDGKSKVWRYDCHLCCVAMMYAKWGYGNMKPDVLNNWKVGSRAHYAFSASGNGDLIRIPQALEYPGISRDYAYYSKATGYDKIYTALSRGWPVIIEIAYNGGSHFMVIYAFDGARYWVLDPLRQPGQGAIPLWGTGYNSSYIKSIRIYGHHL